MQISYKSLFNLEGKTALVTGAVGILGKEFCRGLAEFGADIAVVDVNRELAAEFAESLSKEYSINTLPVFCDVSDPISVAAMVSEVENRFGAIHILHNNAAAKSKDLHKYFEAFTEYELEEWRSMMSVNIDGMFLVAQRVARHMILNNIHGSIIQTSSIYGLMGPDERIYEGSHYMGGPINTPAVYSTSKAAVIGLTRHLATTLAKYNIRVNTIIPGGTESGQNEEFQNKYSTRIPLNRMAQKHEMVGALIYLASDASSYVTGQNLVIDGGLNAW
uniref:SDR family oxidoreductase n=1 Tax=Algoriphagus sp. TaxID=1872435 RepID=UPI0040482B06